MPAIALLALVAAGCGSSHRGAVSKRLVVVPVPSHLSPSVRAAIRRLRANEHRSVVAMVGIDGCYRLVRDHRTHKLTAKPRKRC